MILPSVPNRPRYFDLLLLSTDIFYTFFTTF